MFHHHRTDRVNPAFLEAHAETEAPSNRLDHDVSNLDTVVSPPTAKP